MSAEYRQKGCDSSLVVESTDNGLWFSVWQQDDQGRALLWSGDLSTLIEELLLGAMTVERVIENK